MKKTIISALTLFVIVGFGSVLPKDAVQAETISELESRQSEIQKERSKIKENLSEAEAEIADILIDLEELNEEIVQLNEALEHNQNMLNETEAEIEVLEEEIAVLDEEIAELQEKIDIRSDILKKRITSYQKTGGNIGFLDVIFGAKSFSEFISRVSLVTTITNSDYDLIDQQEADKAQVEATQQKVAEKLAEQNELRTELIGMEELILEQKALSEEAKEELKNKEQELKDLIAELEVKDSDLANLEAQVSRDIEAARNRDRQAQESSNLMTLSYSSSGSGSAHDAINAGYQYVGKTKYVWGSSSPSNGGFDCSGFVSWAFGQAGYSLPSSTAGLSTVGKKVDYSNIQPGDLVFFDTYKTNGHVGIYIGNGQFIGSQSSTGVDIASMSNSYWKKTFKGHVRRVQ